MATDKNTTSLSITQLENTVAKLGTKLARQQGAVKDTEAHISALRNLIDQLKSNK